MNTLRLSVAMLTLAAVGILAGCSTMRIPRIVISRSSPS
jgi:hypothetical protein